MSKNFRLKATDIKPVAEGYGGCVATDRITIDGERVGHMYREAPVDPVDLVPSPTDMEIDGD
jgi:hypothetical protein